MTQQAEAVPTELVQCEHITDTNSFRRKKAVVTKRITLSTDPVTGDKATVEIQLCAYCVDYSMDALQVNKALSHYVNAGGFSQSKRMELATAFLDDHNTLVQLKMGFVAEVIRQFAALPDNYCDLRNQASHEWAKKVIAAVGADHYFPLI